MKTDNILLVDEKDTPCGTEEKLLVHKKGLLHRAFSVFIMNDRGELLLQKRADTKYHSPGLWTNTCCSHPQSDKLDVEFIKSRLQFEMGFTADLDFLFIHRYRAGFDNGLIENELDHVYCGLYNGECSPNKLEVSEVKWASISFISEDIISNPEKYTVWFLQIFPRFVEILQ